MDYVNLKRVILHQQPEKQSGPAQIRLEQMAHNCLEVETGRPFYRSRGKIQVRLFLFISLSNQSIATIIGKLSV